MELSPFEKGGFVKKLFIQIPPTSVTTKNLYTRYGSPSEWQKAMTFAWVEKINTEYKDQKLVIIEGQVNLDFIIEAFKKVKLNQYKIILFHCDNKIRHERLHIDRNQPELVNDDMDNWSEFLKKQAIDKKIPILDIISMNADEMVNQFERIINGDLNNEYIIN